MFINVLCRFRTNTFNFYRCDHVLLGQLTCIVVVEWEQINIVILLPVALTNLSV